MTMRIVAIAMLAVLMSACVTHRGSTPAQKRSAIQQMADEVLADLYARKQSARAEVAAAPGYAVFSNASVNVILASVGGGYGVVRDNGPAGDTYMRMGELGIGIGAGVKDYRVVLVFHDAQTMRDFIESGWAFGGHADAAAKAGDKGGAIGGEAVVDDVSVYQLTESGLALQATVKGTKFWRDPDLN